MKKPLTVRHLYWMATDRLKVALGAAKCALTGHVPNENDESIAFQAFDEDVQDESGIAGIDHFIVGCSRCGETYVGYSEEVSVEDTLGAFGDAPEPEPKPKKATWIH